VPDPSPRPRHRFRTALLVAGAVVVWTLVFEGLARAALALVPALRPAAETRHEADAYAGAAWARAYWHEFAASSRMRWEPYTYWRRQPFAGRYVRVDSAGVRASWAPPSGARPPFRVWFFGGSALWGTGARDAHTISSEVARLLTVRTGRPVEAVNFGESGYVSGQEVVALQRALVSRAAPDAVVFYDGLNDSFAAFQGGHAGWPSNEANRIEEFAFFRDAGAGSYFARGLRTLVFDAGLGRLGGQMEKTPLPARSSASMGRTCARRRPLRRPIRSPCASTGSRSASPSISGRITNSRRCAPTPTSPRSTRAS
jgi:hypothetical protein